MQVNDLLKKFIKSEKQEDIISIGDEELKVGKIDLKHGAKLIFYYDCNDYDNLLTQETRRTLFITNSEGDILYVNGIRGFNSWAWSIHNKFLDINHTEEEKRNFTCMDVTIQEELFNVLKENLELINKKILETIDLEKYRDNAIKKFKDKTEISFPIKPRDLNLTHNLVIDYLFDKSELSKNIFECLDKRKFQAYEQYLAELECIRQYKKALETNPELKGLNDICTAVNGETQSFVIHYTNLKGEKKKRTFKKNVSKMDIVNKTILNHQVLDTIPIECIDKITWRNDVLYDRNNYNKLKFTEEQTATRLILLQHSDDVKPEHFDNEKIMNNAIMIDANIIKQASNRLVNDKNFVLNLMKNIKFEKNEFMFNCLTDLDYLYGLQYIQHKRKIFLEIPLSLKSSKEFLTDYINLFDENDYNKQHMLQSGANGYTEEFLKLLEYHTKRFEFCKFLIEKVGVYRISDIIPEEFMNKKEMIEILKKVKTKIGNLNISEHLNSIENLQALYTEDEIKANICKLHSDIIRNRDFILNHIDENALTVVNSTLFDFYSEDEEIMKKILTSINNEDKCMKYLEYLGIKNTDSAKLFDLCSKNINFIKALTNNDIKLFIDGELSDIESINIKNGLIEIITPNCILNASESSIRVQNKNDDSSNVILNKWTSEIQYIKDALATVLKDNFKLRSRLYESIIMEIKSQKHEELER